VISPIVKRLRDHASSHEWFVDALTEHYNRIAEQAGSDPLPERARQSDHAPVMREAADYIEKLEAQLAARSGEDVLSALKSAEAWLSRWPAHVGNCAGGNNCTCGLTAIRFEAAVALSTEARDDV
jgi:hypothetical protein